jgi:hypothetical protein
LNRKPSPNLRTHEVERLYTIWAELTPEERNDWLGEARTIRIRVFQSELAAFSVCMLGGVVISFQILNGEGLFIDRVVLSLLGGFFLAIDAFIIGFFYKWQKSLFAYLRARI